MENNSTFSPSPAWPTRWPKEAFKFGPSALWLLVIASGFLAGQIAGMAIAAGIFGLAALRDDAVAQMLVMVITWAFVVPLAWWYLPTATRVSLKNLGFAPPNFATLGIAAGGAIAATIASLLVGSATEDLAHGRHAQAVALAFTGIHQPAAIVFFMFAGIVAAPIGEETIFRLFVFNLGMRYGGFPVGAILSAALFATAHWDKYDAPALAAVGLILCAVYYYSKNAFASMIAHGLFNAISFVGLLIDPGAAKG